jgi:hypothetical protein
MPPKLIATRIRTVSRPTFFSINSCAFFIV